MMTVKNDLWSARDPIAGPGPIARAVDYLDRVWACRYFWLSLAYNDLRSRYRRSVLGIAWSLLHPLAMTIVLCAVFHRLFQLDIREYGPSLLVGICFWNYISSVITQGTQCLFQGEPYIRQYPAPIAIYPLRTVLVAQFHFFMALIVTLVVTTVIRGEANPLSLLTLVPTTLLLFVLGWSLAVLAGFATMYFPDTQQLSEVGLQILFYATPIIYPVALVQQRGLGWLLKVNPLASVLEVVRAPLLKGEFPGLELYAYFVAICFGAFLVAVITLVRLQRRIVFLL